ncbi:MAG: aldo/keto reductase [Planctomycetota bacterium]|jgi:predicted aldo/keto reductase-like oxidoreductase
MIYRKLGSTGLEASQLGFGAMRLPMKGEQGDEVDRELAIPMIHRAFEAGVNYIDTAVGYCRKDSQRVVGEALKGWREKIIVSTKNPYYDEDEKAWWQNLEDSLERLQVDSIDIYNHHGLSAKRLEAVQSRVGKWMRKARDQGLIKHICCSFHDNNEALRKIVDTGYPEVITLQYNLLDRQLEDGIAYAHEKGIGIVVMGPVGGGRLGATSDVFEKMVPGVERVPELALRFVLANPNVTVALSGMSEMKHVEENIATAAEEVSLSPEDRKAVDEHLARLKKAADLYCSGCGYCKPCPSEVDIPWVFGIYNQARTYGLWDHARSTYAGLERKERAADKCTECEECIEKCPQDIPIPERLKEAHEALAKGG